MAKGAIGAKKPITRRDFKSGIVLPWEQANRRCKVCGAIDCWNGACTACGSREVAESICRICQTPLVDDRVTYKASLSPDKSVIDTIPAHICFTCGRIYVMQSFADELDEFAKVVPAGFRILPELGISCPQFLEILASAYMDEEAREIKKRSSGGLSIRFGGQSRLFKKALGYITSYGLSDYGHDYSCTLRVRPGPPYSSVQRREIHLLLSQLSMTVGGGLQFWSVHFDPSEFDENPIEPYKRLLRSIQQWPEDEHCVALSLMNEIVSETGLNLLIDTFRLLELVLDRLIETDISVARNDSNIANDEFIRMVRRTSADLKSKIRWRVETLSTKDSSILRDLWRVIVPGERFDQNGVYDRIAKLRNSIVHRPIDPDVPPLPWEKPPLQYIATKLLELIRLFVVGNPKKAT